MRDRIHPTAARIGSAVERTVLLEQHAVTVSHRMNAIARRKPTTAELIRANAARANLFLRCFAARARRPQTIRHP